MSCLSNGIAHRRIVLFCARLLVQCAMAWSTSQTGMDEARCVHAPHGACNAHDASYAGEPASRGFGDGLAAFQKDEQRRPG
jgi:hypothetical protein